MEEDAIPELNRHLAADLEEAAGIVEAEPYERGVHIWLTDGGFGFLNLYEDYDFRIMDCFALSVLSGPNHRHWRPEPATIFITLVTDLDEVGDE